MSKGKKVKAVLAIIIVLAIAFVSVGLIVADRYNVIPKKWYTAEDFGITEIKSSVDFNKNGIDDYSDIVLGARKDAENHPKYDGRYYDGGFPPDNIGVCTDVVWRAFKNAGYDLREMVDLDIQLRPEAYTYVEKRDKNIDFRRVKNLLVFFREHAIELTVDVEQIEEWQPGDIVIFNGDKHIGIVSDKRSVDGMPYIIHNGGQPNREEDYLDWGNPTSHFRFDASLVDESLLIAWED
ncbi:MAG: DUF1287 domain-containing protein [Eubacterium sp.]|nr:DUF1287 domain-containing protein [Eubacterium sp.]